MLGTLNRKQIDNVLHSQVVGRLGCYSDRVYVVPITYAYDGDYIYGHTIEGLKIRMMRNNPNVCIEVEQIENLAHWQTVILWGTYEELKGDNAEDALQLLINRTQPLMTSETSRPKHGLDRAGGMRRTDKRTITFRIKVEQATGRYEKR
ncbi:MAG: pyridoxamine 5'-phosphate oxidase family protein [Fulvivirga sp.]|uniref:pyridoxamine 5'-phosphate oxidase family protein n=1 Tax=Fulvivirga sp. TaxID=1931237 RepID=UPI0032EED227